MNWFQLIERQLVDTILRSTAFRRTVEKIHDQVHRIQHGAPAQHARGGTYINEPGKKGVGDLAKLFWEEVKTGHRPDSKPKK